MPRLIACLLALVLAACTPGGGYRDGALGIPPLAGFDRTAWAGDWVQTGDFSRYPQACLPGRLTVQPLSADRVILAGRLCIGGKAEALNLLHASIGTDGALRLSGAALKRFGAPWQVIYQGYGGDSLAVATPSGAFGFILSRTGRLPGHDVAAIRKAFAARGYDLQNLRFLR